MKHLAKEIKCFYNMLYEELSLYRATFMFLERIGIVRTLRQAVYR